MSPSAPMAKVLSTEPLDPKEAKWTELVKLNYADQTGAHRTWESAERTTRPESCGVDGVGIVAILRYPEGCKPAPSSSSSSSSGSSSSTANHVNHTNGTTYHNDNNNTARREEEEEEQRQDEQDDEQDEGPLVVLQKQYRPPIDAICIEFPAGLIDAGEDPEQAALRELREETGYHGTLLPMTSATTTTRAPTTRTPIMFNDPGFCNTNLVMVHVDVDMSLTQNRDPKPELEDGEYIDCFTVPLGRLWRECVRLEREGYAIDARVGGLAEGWEMARAFGFGAAGKVR
ncbi:NUDIX hydrolase domain-like protein [Microdochium trichocladiopsis]|uniref:NUDIX hydrolase domain-like protein n=1 Tax=Microdochium trichocladiopsis TaxID=1682393 RepID=A0A9P8YCU3_9PEZI|nr:NUDIX hydrolase domain-like protein [Microdochium trichocladiopsis]KAH7037100.1 NUDIX hydrolase domain-like protein [Microdochium trichocladiopsis]